MSQKLELVAQPQDFFRELLSDAFSKLRIKPKPQLETEVYLMEVLSHFMVTENLYLRNSQGQLVDQPLALLVKEASEEATPDFQRLMFRKVGDLALYFTGFFRESIERKKLPISYYIDVGGVAYSQAAQLADANRTVYEELAQRFPSFVDVFFEVSTRTTPHPKTESELLRVYETWRDSGSERAAHLLQAAGILKKN